MQITLGDGKVAIMTVSQDGRTGVLLQAVDEAHPVGSWSFDMPDEYVPTDRDVVIWIDKVEGGRILQDVVNRALLELQGVIPLGIQSPGEELAKAAKAAEDGE